MNCGSDPLSAYEIAKKMYETCPGMDLDADILEYSRVGVAYVSNSCLLLGCRSGGGWFVRMAVGAGCLAKFIDLAPYHLPYVGWARCFRGRWHVKWHKTDAVKRIIRYENKKRTV